ncbi:MAG TPA: 16S rRNA (cytosine(1402)-N(4))-methyltransferase RsmH [Chitinophagales bacterium]|nr:16S rRNA (cytosine(1402)-N(4))-methyltransferase RsmH [Chitinophagales bacterium]HRP40006.1 16S rRNA (cytosine(1402)-N(4))-methyltransferase RsmH [Chitinophagales bacterium]
MSSEQNNYHVPVLLHECVEALNILPDGVYVDTTFGGGGHSREILKHLSAKGKLIAFDQDADAKQNLPSDERLVFIPQNFRHLQRFLRAEGFAKVNGILADLGVSSFQFDTAERGFSYRFDGALDMRMNVNSGRTAADILNQESAATLQQIFGEYGEVRNAKTLAEKIAEVRFQKQFKTISDLLNVCEVVMKGDKHRYWAQVFQALRIEVNDELSALKDLLEQSAKVLKPNGILAVITFHSLEDRLVKNFMKTGNFEGEHIKDDFGNIERLFDVKTKKPIEANAQELKQNSRARSAKLRVAIKR